MKLKFALLEQSKNNLLYHLRKKDIHLAVEKSLDPALHKKDVSRLPNATPTSSIAKGNNTRY
ncbi:hypothetical protein TAMA11512_13470 [Selenomonas sp. TAMA-11512]|nr:hypothetical protein TAMA11512_13470 [Selenomonas sp. TAMA-11512]